MFKHDRFINFYISLEKNAKNCNISATVRRISIKFNVMKQNVSLKCKAVKNLNFNIPRWRTAAITQLEEMRYFMMMQNGCLKHVDRPPS